MNVKSVQDALEVQTGNAIAPWRTETERKAANNAWLAPYGLSADKNYQLFDADKNYIRPRVAPDGMGGVFNPEGNSSNPNFLKGTIGVGRDQLAGFETLSDKALMNAYGVNGAGNRTFANDLWMDPRSGVISSMQSEGSVNVGDVRRTLAEKTGQQHVDAFGAAAPFVKPGYYGGAGDNTADMAARQQAFMQKLLVTPKPPEPAAAKPAGPENAAFPAPSAAAVPPAAPKAPETPAMAAPLASVSVQELQEELRRRGRQNENALYRALIAAQ